MHFLQNKKNITAMVLQIFFITLLALNSFSYALAIDTEDTRLLSQPAISKNLIAFVYAKDLWIANTDGTSVKRLTSGGENVTNPVFSPDGSLIAFSCEINGNRDVYIIPSTGGIIKRLTWHPKKDTLIGFTPDGNSVYFISERNSFFHVKRNLFTVSIEGEFPEEQPLPSISRGSYSPDGNFIAFNPLPYAFIEWKNYRGGMVSEIWIYNRENHSVKKIAQPKTFCNDIYPRWIEDKIFFLSDREGEFNIFSYDTVSEEIKKLTYHQDFPVLSFSVNDDKIIYEQGGYLHLYDRTANISKKLTIGVGADITGLRETYIKAHSFIRNFSISPAGARAVIEARGEIITVPEKKGDPRNITETPGVHERSPSWSPDGKYIAYFADASGEYELHIKSQDGKGKEKTFELPGSGFYEEPVWSPDSTKIAYTDNSWSLYWIDLKTGTSTKIAQEQFYGPEKSIVPAWSPDGNWICYTLNSEVFIRKIFLYSLQEDKSYPLTDGMSDTSNPVFDRSGKYLYFFSSTDAGPVRQWFDLSSYDMEMTEVIYLTVLSKEDGSPLAKKSDEANIEENNEESNEESNEKKEHQKTVIDLKGIEDRILALPLASADYTNLQTGKDGEIYYIKEIDGSSNLYRYNLTEREEEIFLHNVSSYIISENKEKLLYSSNRGFYGIVSTGSHPQAGEGRIETENIEIKINPPEEWKEIYNDAWRINRDFFYDPAMHGVDWNKMKEKYEVFLPHLTCREDLYKVLMWLGSELKVGHHFTWPIYYLSPPESLNTGLLGADYEIEKGKYRIKKIYGGANWSPELRSPLTEPGINVNTGDYILEVNGIPLTSKINIYSLFENRAEKITEITVSSTPSGADKRTVSVVPIADDLPLMKKDWIEGNIERVNEATGGRAAYIYVPDTTTAGHTYFKRYFFPQSYKEAVIIDERHNGGGQFADYYLDILKRQFACWFSTRYGNEMMVPQSFIPGPKVMIINETAGSGGDLLPWLFRKFNMGILIGKRTWGGLVGNLGFPVLMDGSYITAPNFGAWYRDEWILENKGVSPDIEVEQWPAEVIEGKDPQLEEAIKVILKELEENPPEKFERPPYPVK